MEMLKFAMNKCGFHRRTHWNFTGVSETACNKKWELKENPSNMGSLSNYPLVI